MDLRRIPFKEEGNPLHPLPFDYDTLTREGQSLARINGCRQWMLPVGAFPHPLLGLPPRLLKQKAALAALDLFDHYYLWPDPDDNFDPQFYDDQPLETPDFHFDMAAPWYTDRATIGVFPRGSGKSVTCRKDMILRLLTRPLYSFVYSTSTNKNAEDTSQACKDQCYYNRRIADDFSSLPEFEGRIKPHRGEKATGVEMFYLTNGAWLQAISAESRQRGKRPRRYRLDDPEYDEKKTTSMAARRDYMKMLIFKVVLPMVLRGGVGVDWIGTYVSQRHYLWHATEIENTPEGPRARDRRFDFWTRTLIRAAGQDPDTGELLSCWPEMWPATRKVRLFLAQKDSSYNDRLSLEEIRDDVLGSAVFNSEMQGNPGRSDETFFPEVTEKGHGFHLLQPDELLPLAPRLSNTLIRFHRPGKEGTFDPVEMTLQSFLAQCRIFMCCDYAFTHSPDSDYKTSWVMAHLPTRNELFLLEGWHGKVKKEKQIAEIFRMVDRWQCPLVCPEVVKESVVLYNDLVERVQTRSMDVMGHSFIPRVRAIKPGAEPKVEKISSLHIRFEHCLIKFPWWLRTTEPYATLLDQVDGFIPELDNGGLEKDDDLDTIAMSKFVLKGRRKEPKPEDQGPKDAVKEIIAGRGDMPTFGINVGVAVDWTRVPIDQINAVLARAANGGVPSERSKV